MACGFRTQKFCRLDRLQEIGAWFGIVKYSSVSSMIEGTRQRLKTDRRFKKRITKLWVGKCLTHIGTEGKRFTDNRQSENKRAFHFKYIGRISDRYNEVKRLEGRSVNFEGEFGQGKRAG